MSSLDLAMLMENLRREADILLRKKQPFSITVSYDGTYLNSSLRDNSTPYTEELPQPIKEI